MARWRCETCGREFDRQGQSHRCIPGTTVDGAFAGRPPYQRAAYDLLVEPLRALGHAGGGGDPADVLHEDAVGVGVFWKRQRKLAELRPKATMLQVTLYLPTTVPSPSVVRRMAYGDRVLHVVNLRTVAEVTDDLADLVLEAWEDAAPAIA